MWKRTKEVGIDNVTTTHPTGPTAYIKKKGLPTQREKEGDACTILDHACLGKKRSENRRNRRKKDRRSLESDRTEASGRFFFFVPLVLFYFLDRRISGVGFFTRRAWRRKTKDRVSSTRRPRLRTRSYRFEQQPGSWKEAKKRSFFFYKYKRRADVDFIFGGSSVRRAPSHRNCNTIRSKSL